MKPKRVRTPRALIIALAALFGHCLVANAQSQNPAPVTVEIQQQPTNPLRLEVLSIEVKLPFGAKPEADRGKEFGPEQYTIRLKVENIGNKPIRGYAIDFQGEKVRMISTTTLAKFIEMARLNPIPTTASGEWSKILISVDYVEFSDGTSWGNDSFNRSKLIDRFLKGRDLAIRRLNELVPTYPNPEFFLNQVNALNGVSTADPFPVASDAMLQRQFEFGYDSVLKGLRSPSKRLAEGQEIARRLELMGPAH